MNMCSVELSSLTQLMEGQPEQLSDSTSHQ